MTDLMLNGPAGRLEAKLNINKSPNAPLALILHPHPLFGGTMNNKVVFNLYKSLYENGFTTLRFNFRGVGKSEGTYDNGEGELHDASAALDWFQNTFEKASSCWITGFSFGSWIGFQLLMRRPEVENFIAISPPASKYDFSFLSPCPRSGLIVQGTNDEVITESSVTTLAYKLSKQKNIEIDYKIIAGASHFFENHMDELNQNITDYIAKTLHKS
ncbi:MAG: alpha/beta hydrolase [Alphaproteobacteria bacterium]|nr:alpha/beta hydrolase [Alphaproteobacteria bacterium]MBP9877601.1 alpha/beta hydrolase [Alphaproteobacteria bacterium]